MAITTRKKTVREVSRAVAPETQTLSTHLNKLNLSILLKNKKLTGAIAILVIIIIALAVMFKSVFIAAMVNGQPISRLSVVTALEKQGGKTTLDNLITKQLILQESKKKNITIAQSEIDSEIKKIRENLQKQGSTLEDALTSQNMTMSNLSEEIKTQLTVNKLVGNISITEKEINDFVTANKAQMAPGTTEAQFRQQAIAALKQQMLQTKAQEFLKNLQNKANVLRFVSY